MRFVEDSYKDGKPSEFVNVIELNPNYGLVMELEGTINKAIQQVVDKHPELKKNKHQLEIYTTVEVLPYHDPSDIDMTCLKYKIYVRYIKKTKQIKRWF